MKTVLQELTEATEMEDMKIARCAAGVGLLERGCGLEKVWPDRLVPLATLRPGSPDRHSSNHPFFRQGDGLVADLTGLSWEKLGEISRQVPSAPVEDVLDSVRQVWLPAELFAAVMTPEEVRSLAWHFPRALDVLDGKADRG